MSLPKEIDRERNVPSTYQEVLRHLNLLDKEVMPFIEMLKNALLSAGDELGDSYSDVVIDGEGNLRAIGTTVMVNHVYDDLRPVDYIRDIIYELKDASVIGLAGKPGVSLRYVTMKTTSVHRKPAEVNYPVWQYAYCDKCGETYYRQAIDEYTWGTWIRTVDLEALLEENQELLKRLSHRQVLESKMLPEGQDMGDYWFWPIVPGEDPLGEHTHRDPDGDGFCDVCGEPIPDHTHWDDDGDGWCDECGAPIPPHDHKDFDGDGRCDECGAPIPNHNHHDDDGDGRCDECGAPYDDILTDYYLVSADKSGEEIRITLHEWKNYAFILLPDETKLSDDEKNPANSYYLDNGEGDQLSGSFGPTDISTGFFLQDIENPGNMTELVESTINTLVITDIVSGSPDESDGEYSLRPIGTEFMYLLQNLENPGDTIEITERELNGFGMIDSASGSPVGSDDYSLAEV